MIIGIDGNEANVEQHVGVSVYTFNLLSYFHTQASENTQFRIYLRNQPLSLLPKENEWFKYKVVKPRFLWSQISLPFYLSTHRNIDVFFAPAHYAPRKCPVPYVVAIHDLAYFYYPQEFLKRDLYKLKSWTEYSVNKAKSVIAVSKTTKKDLLRHYALADKKVEVVYNGFEKQIEKPLTKSETHALLKRLNLSPEKFILYVGTLQPRKNVVTLIRAFAKYHQQNPDYRLAIVGRKGWLYEDIYAEVEKLNLTESVVFTGFLSDAELAQMYTDALCYVMPSKYEGFGIPVLEAMAAGCPVISSFSSSLPEIGGEACLYFDPESVSDLTDKLHIITVDHDFERELIGKGKERIKDFSWQKCGKETLEVIRKAAAG